MKNQRSSLMITIYSFTICDRSINDAHTDRVEWPRCKRDVAKRRDAYLHRAVAVAQEVGPLRKPRKSPNAIRTEYALIDRLVLLDEEQRDRLKALGYGN